MQINEYGQVQISESEAFTALYSGKIENLNNLYLDDVNAIAQYNAAISKNADRLSTLTPLIAIQQSIESFDRANQNKWFMPEEYKNFDIVNWLFDQCATDEQKDRVEMEIMLFVQHGMYDLLCYLKYLVDTLRKNKVLWGAGRGSSVASYCLFLIGVHRVDSLKYELDIKEFLK